MRGAMLIPKLYSRWSDAQMLPWFFYNDLQSIHPTKECPDLFSPSRTFVSFVVTDFPDSAP
jgi:hypothetical protein